MAVTSYNTEVCFRPYRVGLFVTSEHATTPTFGGYYVICYTFVLYVI